jgi:hypothetical protein
VLWIFADLAARIFRKLLILRRSIRINYWSSHWYNRLAAIEQLEALPSPWVDRATLEFTLGVGRRRAQQILQPLVRHTIGKNGLADRDELIRHLRTVAAGESASYENQRRQAFARQFGAICHDRRTSVIVAAPSAVVNQEFDDLPAGVTVAPGHISVQFSTPTEALQKLLALAMAIRNDAMRFERLASGS